MRLGQRPYPSFADVQADPRLVPRLVEVLAVHVAPGLADGPGIHPALPDAELGRLTNDAEAKLVFVGHTHWPLDRTVAGVRVINVGSLSNPWSADLRASYVVLDATEAGYQIQHRRVAYDYQAVIDAVQQSRHPTGGSITSYFRAERTTWWTTANEVGSPR